MARSPRSAAVNIIKRLREQGHTAYLAGGCVRDELLGVTPKDFDVATDAHPAQLSQLFQRTAQVGASFGVVIVREFGPTIEVATFRSDGPYTDRRRPDSVEFAGPEQDAHRRDFTINALFIDPLADDPDHRIIDHVQGLQDIHDRLLRAVGDPDQRLAEDHLRALRAVRFAARYDLAIHPDTARAIRQHARQLAGVSVERIGHEIKRMFNHPSRTRAARLICELGLDEPILGKPLPDTPRPTLDALDPAAHAETALAAWAYDRLGRSVLSETGANASGWRGHLDFSAEQARAFAKPLDFAGRVLRDWPELATAQRKRLAAAPLADQGLLLLRAISPNAARAFQHDAERLANDGIGIHPPPLLTGEHLLEAGYKPGPMFGKWLEEAYNAQLEGRVRTTEDALALVQQLNPPSPEKDDGNKNPRQPYI